MISSSCHTTNSSYIHFTHNLTNSILQSALLKIHILLPNGQKIDVLSYSRDTDKTAGPVALYWTFYAWVPQWGMVCSLLFLARTDNQDRNAHGSPSPYSGQTHTSQSGSINMNCDVSVTFSEDDRDGLNHANLDHSYTTALDTSTTLPAHLSTPTRQEMSQGNSRTFFTILRQ